MTIKYLGSRRISGLSTDVGDPPTFSDPMTSAWANIEGSNVVVGSGLLNYDQGTSDHGAYKDTGSSLSNTFVSRFKWNVDALAEGSDNANNEVNICISSNVGDNGTYNDAVGLMLRVDSGQTTLLFGIWDNATPAVVTPTVNATIVEPLTTGVYYVEIVRRSNRVFILRIYTDSDYTTLLYSSSLTNSADLVALRYLKVMTNNEPDADSTNNGSIDDWNIYDAKTSLSPYPTNVETDTIFIDTDVRRWFNGTGWGDKSMYEAFNPLTVVGKQHFVEWFSGKALNSIWTTNNFTGSGSFTMADEVDGGFGVSDAGSGYSKSGISFNNKKQYDNDNSVCISVTRSSSANTLPYAMAGLSETGYDDASSLCYAGKINDSNFGVATKDGSTLSLASGSNANDTNFHVYKQVLSASDVEMFFDGVTDVNKTTNLPVTRLQPTVLSMGNGIGSVVTTSIRYMECYNT